MLRRTFVAAAAGIASAGTAGCLGGAGGPGTPDTPTPPAGRPDPRIVDRSFERTGDADVGSESAEIAFGDGAVTVAGVVRGANGCMRPTLAAVEYDADGDLLRVRVSTVKEGEACTQQIVYRGYEARIAFENGLPGRVVVEHGSAGGTRTVAEASR